MKRPIESDYTSHVAYTRALEEYCDALAQPAPVQEPWRESASDYERGVIDGRQMQAQSSVDKAVNAMTQPTYFIPSKDQRTWVGLTRDEQSAVYRNLFNATSRTDSFWVDFANAIEAKLKEKNQ